MDKFCFPNCCLSYQQSDIHASLCWSCYCCLTLVVLLCAVVLSKSRFVCGFKSIYELQVVSPSDKLMFALIDSSELE